MDNRLFQRVLTGRKKIDGKYCPDVRFGYSVHKMMEFLIQKKAGERSNRLRLCTRGTWGEGAVGVAALPGKVGRGPSTVPQPAETYL